MDLQDFRIRVTLQLRFPSTSGNHNEGGGMGGEGAIVFATGLNIVLGGLITVQSPGSAPRGFGVVQRPAFVHRTF